MVNKKWNKILLSQIKKNKSKQLKNDRERVVWLWDLTHDLENQLVKITQKLEYLRTKIYRTDPIPLQEQYKEICEDYSADVGNTMALVDRTVHQMFCEIACVTILDWRSNKINDYKDKHEKIIHKTILRILLLHSNEMTKRSIRYKLEPSDDKWLISEYVFSAIILKIVENCTKYCMPNSELNIKIKNNQITFTMKSLKIENKEVNKIFENGFSWKNAIKIWKKWSWKGLFHAKKLADFHGLTLSLEIARYSETINWVKYATNKFYIIKK